jgi:hypothetical protein
MSAAIVQQDAWASNGSHNPWTQSVFVELFNQFVTAGNAIVVCWQGGGGGSPNPLTSITDNYGNSYSKIAGASLNDSGNTGYDGEFWIAYNVAGVTSAKELQLTFAYSGSASPFVGFWALEISGITGATLVTGTKSVGFTANPFTGVSLNGGSGAIDLTGVVGGNSRFTTVALPWSVYQSTFLPEAEAPLVATLVSSGVQQPTFANGGFDGIVCGLAFIPASATGGPSAPITPTYVPRRIQLFGIISSGANAGKVCAVACDSNGNLALSGGSGGVINTIDVLGLPADAVPAMIYGAASGSSIVPGSTALVAVAVDQYGNILASRGTGGGSPGTTVDTPSACDTNSTPVQIFARAPNGNVIGVPVSSAGALGNTLNPITNVPVTQIDQAQAENSPLPLPVLLCGRIASGYPNAGEIVGAQLDSTGALCVSGSSGASTAPTQVTTFNNGECMLLQLYGRTSAGQMVSVPLTSAGSLLLN